jgi:MFS family permease
MTTSTRLLNRRRFLPLFVTQLLNAFNDNLYKTAMVLFVVYSVYNDEAKEAQFSAIASGVFIAPFFLLSAMAGQLADMRDKARIIRLVKLAEIFIMLVGAAGLLIAWQDVACARLGGAGLGWGPPLRCWPMRRSRCCWPRCSPWASIRPSSARSNTRSCPST